MTTETVSNEIQPVRVKGSIQELDMNAVLHQMGDVLINNGLKGRFAISVLLKDVPAVVIDKDGEKQTVYNLVHNWDDPQ